MSDLPSGWEWATLGDVCDINPRSFDNPPLDSDVVSVVPMAAVEVEKGLLDPSQIQEYGPLKAKSLTRFQEGDVLFAKITPCMENGKIAVAKGLHGGRALGSTEFHVLRPMDGIMPEYLCHFLLQKSIRSDAERKMTGAVGQRRVPRSYLEQLSVPIPPVAEQRRIVAALEEHLSRLEVGAAAVRRAEKRIVVALRSHLNALVDNLAPQRSLGSILREPLRNGYSGRSSQDGSGVRTLTLTAVTKGEFVDDHTKMATVNGRKIDDLWLKPGDILVQRSNTPELVGTSALYVGPTGWAIFPDLLIRVRVNHEVLAEYVQLALSAPKVRKILKESAKGLAGTMPKIDQGTLERVPIPVPSLAVQERIVQLADEFGRAIRRLATELAATQSRGAALRRSLLVDAFAGRLVPQDPNDESASVLLERLRVERAAQLKVKRTRRAKNINQETLL